MSIEYLGEKVFRDEVLSTGKVWVARSIYHNIYTQDFPEEGFSLPVWSTRERVLEFLKNARLVGPPYAPDAVPLELVADTWLSDQAMAIVELQINPDGRTTRVLVFTAEEFRTLHFST